MGTLFEERVKDVITAFTHFIDETLSKEKLSSKAEEEKVILKKLVERIKDTFPVLRSQSESPKDKPPSLSRSDSIPNIVDAEGAKSGTISGSEILARATISGYLKKKSESQKSSKLKINLNLHNILHDGIMGKPKKKWCGVMDGAFYIYEKPTDKKQKGQINLSTATVKKYDGGKKVPFGFEVVCASSGSHVFFASNDTELRSWMNALGYKEAVTAPVEDDGEAYEEVGSPVRPTAKPAVSVNDDDDTDDDEDIDYIYYKEDEEESKPGGVSSEDVAGPAQGMEEDYDDVDVSTAAITPIRPPAPVKRESKPISAQKKPVPEPPGVNYENLYYALWSRTADQPDELSFKQADVLLVKNKVFDKQSWWAAEAEGRVGYVPKNFLTPVYQYVAVK